MISFKLWLAFVATVSILAITPGTSTLLTASNAMVYSVRHTTWTILGDLSANVIQMLLAGLGLGAILLASEKVFYGMKWAGVAYLVYLGIKQWFSNPATIPAGQPIKIVTPRKLYLQGFGVSAANPKAVLFFAALFPLFLNPASAKVPQFVILGATFVILDGTSLYLYARFAERISRWLVDRGRQCWQNRITGSLLIGSAFALARLKRS